MNARLSERPNKNTEPFSAFRAVPKTGVIYVMAEAAAAGYSPTDPQWANLGQGQPETGDLPGAPPRVSQILILDEDQEYAPVQGLMELREAVAAHYNATYRRGLPSQYTAENVAIGGGGRVSIMRACAAVGAVHLGHFLPDYTAYEELLDVFRRFTPIPILLDPESHYEFSEQQLRREVLGRGLGALLLSNPCNPTGKLISGSQLESWVRLSRELDFALMVDEFYSHYIWNANTQVSGAAFVENVDEDPVILFDGLTKNWRYPGWRICWTVGPKHLIQAIASAGSFLDGGASRPMQRAAVDLLTPEHVQAERAAIQTNFRTKRDFLLEALRKMGVRFSHDPEGTFYCWGDVSDVRGLGANGPTDGETFFRHALQKKVITVPGTFFDIDPGKRRSARHSRFAHHVRFSFGPELQTLERAVQALSGS